MGDHHHHDHDHHHHHEQGLVEDFNFDEPYSISGSTTIVLSGSPTVLAFLSGATVLHHVDPNDRIRLVATVGWQATGGTTISSVLFKIYRDAPPPTGTLVFSTTDWAEPSFDAIETTSFSHVETGVHGHATSYFLTAEVTSGTANVIGPISFSGEVIEHNR